MRLAKTWVWTDRSAIFTLPKFHGLGEITWQNQIGVSFQIFPITEMKENKSLHLSLFANIHMMQDWLSLGLSLRFQLLSYERISGQFPSGFLKTLEERGQKLSLRQRNWSPSQVCQSRFLFKTCLRLLRCCFSSDSLALAGFLSCFQCKDTLHLRIHPFLSLHLSFC